MREREGGESGGGIEACVQNVRANVCVWLCIPGQYFSGEAKEGEGGRERGREGEKRERDRARRGIDGGEGERTTVSQRQMYETD